MAAQISKDLAAELEEYREGGERARLYREKALAEGTPIREEYDDSRLPHYAVKRHTTRPTKYYSGPAISGEVFSAEFSTEDHIQRLPRKQATDLARKMIELKINAEVVWVGPAQSASGAGVLGVQTS